MQVGTGKSILNGIAIGKLKIYKKKNTTISAAEVADTAAEVARFEEAQQTSGEAYSGDWGERHDEELDAQQTSGEADAAPQAVPYTELPLDAEGYPVE